MSVATKDIIPESVAPSNQWSVILNIFNNDETEICTSPKNKRESLWFSVRIIDNFVCVSNAKVNSPSSKLKKYRKLGHAEFTRMYPIYLKRKAGYAVSAEASAASHNQTYWYAIMDYCGL